ncbi:hypothetical protein J4234_04995 [Candidatus Woesearchaeota archaeon]|nr:hypothetical protein [Candidatus Woesearchaeota archaeon]
MDLVKLKQLDEEKTREFHLWDFQDNLFILLDKEANDRFFKIMYNQFGTQQEFAKFLGLWRQEVNKYHKQLLKDNGRYYPVYFPIRLFKKCVPILDKEFICYLEQNVSEIRARVGLSVYNPKLPIRESQEVYRILAHIIADGSASKGKTPYYANTCKQLREQFKKDLAIFGEMKIYERKPQVTELVFFPKVVTDLLASLFDIQFTYPNRIPKLIFTASEDLKKNFLQALFDDEGTISAQLALTIHNVRIMEEIKSLIISLGINVSKVMVYYYSHKTNKVYFQISKKDYELFQKKIGFSHPEKAKKLELAIRTQNREQRTRNPNYIEQEIIKILEMKPSPTMELANKLMLTIMGIKPHLDRMLEEGLIIKRGYKNKVIWDIA